MALVRWVVVLSVVLTPLAIAAASPLLSWRDPIYIVAGLAGIVAMGLMLLQPLLIGGLLPGTRQFPVRRLHRFVGLTILLMVIVHVAGLWIFSPPDVLDALLLRSPAPFSIWGVAAIWLLILTLGAIAASRTQRSKIKLMRTVHTLGACLVVACTAVHAWLVEGTMGTVSKAVLCVFLVLATFWLAYRRNARFFK